jgi:N,N-dimethylformamidase
MRPKSLLWTLCADLLLIDWLEARNHRYDVITDELLQAEGADLLRPYSVIITGNHPEYSTAKQLSALEAFVASGGHLMYLGGNGYYWRTAVNEQFPGAIEVRRGRTGTGMWQSNVGESSLAFSGEVGGIWRDLGRPPQQLLGVGFIAQGKGGSWYRVLSQARASPAAFILEGVSNDLIGNFGVFEGGAAGQEIDSTSASLGTPSSAVVIARSENHGPGMLHVIEAMTATDPVIDHYRAATCAEIVFLQMPHGGAVFSVGSMAWCGSLSHNDYDNDIATITDNVLSRFLGE